MFGALAPEVARLRKKIVHDAIPIALLIATIPTLGFGCSQLALVGYFHQVTAIRGRVVGRNLGPVQFRWLRQCFGVSGAKLTLYEYRSLAGIKDLKLIATVKTDPRGDFDFGSIARGHYVLSIETGDSRLMGGSYDVEVIDTVRPTERITIDVSPIRPDCSGGHEFMETKKA